MTYITNNATLVALIANVATPVTGEDDLFTKINPQLIMAERWLHMNVAPVSTLANPSEDELHLIRTIVAYEAFRNAIPVLNMVLTDNGFGIVSNQTVAPASKERTDALIRSLIAQRDAAIEMLNLLHGGVGTVFSGIVFAGYAAQRAQGITENLFEIYLKQRNRIIEIQQVVEKQVFSSEVFSALMGYTYSSIADIPTAYQALMPKVEDLIVYNLSGDDYRAIRRKCAGIVDYIRNNETAFPNWADSEAAEFWADRTYKNDKDSGGFWM